MADQPNNRKLKLILAILLKLVDLGWLRGKCSNEEMDLGDSVPAAITAKESKMPPMRFQTNWFPALTSYHLLQLEDLSSLVWGKVINLFLREVHDLLKQRLLHLRGQLHKPHIRKVKRRAGKIETVTNLIGLPHKLKRIWMNYRCRTWRLTALAHLTRD